MQDTDRLDNQRGLDREIQAKLAAKFDSGKAIACLNWIAAVTGKEIQQTGNPASDFGNALKDGYLLGMLVKKIGKGTFKGKNKKAKFKHTKLPFPAREQIQRFVELCKALKMKATDVCTPNDLYDGDNLNNVVNHLYSLNAIAQGLEKFDGPYLEGAAVKHADKNVRNFSQATLREGRNQVGLLAQGMEMKDEATGMDSCGIIKTNLVSKSNAVPLMSQGANSQEASGYDAQGIVKLKTLDKSVAKNIVPLLSQGGAEVDENKFDGTGIVRMAGLDSVAPSAVPKQSQGSNAPDHNTYDSAGIVRAAGLDKSADPSAVPKQSQGSNAVEAEAGMDNYGIVKVKPDGTLISKQV